MAGLDTRGLVDGFAKGFGLVDNYYDKEEDRARRDRIDEENRQHRDRVLSNQDRQFEATQSQRDQSQQNWEKSFEQQQKQADRSYGLQQAGLSYQKSRDAKQDALREEDRQKEKDMQVIQAGYQALFSGANLDETTYKTMEKYPHLSPSRFLDPEFSSAVTDLSAAIQNGNVQSDDQLLALANRPDVLNAFNTLYAPQIQKGDGGTKRIVQVLPGRQPGTLTFDLEVTPKEGKPYRAPLTVNRGTDPEDAVKQVSVGEISKQLAGYQVLNRVAQLPEYRTRLERFAQGTGMSSSKNAEWSRLNDSAVLNKKTGEVKTVQGKSTDKPSTNQKKYQEMLDLGVPEPVARGVSYGTFKSITDPNSGGQLLVDVATGKTVGGFVPVDPDDPFGEMRWQSMTAEPSASAEPSREDNIAKVMQANPSYDRDKAIAYLKHIQRW